MLDRCSHFVLIVISGAVWCLIGIFLMRLGMNHIVESMRFYEEGIFSSSFSVFKYLSHYVSDPKYALVLLVGICLILGYCKGHFILQKRVKAGVRRIMICPNPSNIGAIYSKGYYGIIFGMMCLGFILRRLKISEELLGAIDLTVGSALLKGSFSYFRYALAEKRGTLAEEK